MKQQQHFVIVGGGQSGGCAASALRDGGFEGAITLVTEEPYPPYERPPLSKDVLMEKENYPYCYMNPEDFYAEKNVRLLLSTRVEIIDRANKRLDTDTGESLEYDKLLLATGGRVRRLPIAGADLEAVYYLRNIDDMLALQAGIKQSSSLVVIGGGFISLEVAAAARTMGLKVTVLEVLPRILARVLEEDVGDIVQSVHEEQGVDIRTGVNVEAICGDGRVTGVRLADGEVIEADLVVIGIGIVPNTELAEAAGLEVNNGIVVNEFGETSDPDIYACGDVTQHPNSLFGKSMRLETWQNAQSQASAVAQVLCGERLPYQEVPWFWSDQFDMNLQMAGLSDDYDQVVRRADGTAHEITNVYLKKGVLVGVVATNRPRDIMAARKLIAKKVCMDVEKLADPTLDLRKAVIK